MMRSMYSGVAGLKTHQTKMDVIGNNIANVNTTAYKSASTNFSELLYQTTSKASGPNGTTGRAGINPKQIGLGVQAAAIKNAITTPGSTQSTGDPFDVKINGEAFFVVSDGTSNYFTRDGSFYVDAAGNLAMTSNGYNVMGWGLDETGLNIKKDTVSALRVMSAANMTYPPEATTEAYVDGILDKNEPDAATTAGKTLTLSFFDALGYSYTAKFALHQTETKGEYTVELTDILDSEANSVIDTYGVNGITDIVNFGGSSTSDTTELRQLVTGVSYTPGASDTDPGTYTKTVGYDELFSDYEDKAMSGLVYSNPVKGAAAMKAGDTIAAGDTITLTGTGKVTKKDLQDIYGLIYVEGEGGDPDYYYKDGVRLYNPNNLGAGVNAATNKTNWQTVLNKGDLAADPDPGISWDDEGNVSFNLTQDFTVAAPGTYDGANFTIEISQDDAYGMDTTNPNKTYLYEVAPDGQAQVTTTTTYNGYVLKFNVDTGRFVSIDNKDSVTLDFNPSAMTKAGTSVSLANFSDINIDWTNVTWYNNGGSSTMTATAGTESTGEGAGRKLGAMNGLSIQNNGEIYAAYDNGMTKLLGQIAVAKFANASGLEKVGDNLYQSTLNSGEFDGVGVDITADGEGSMTSGALEMSNVDLSTEFTEMITTQRGFQANSRIITVSDTLLEELVNLKR